MAVSSLGYEAYSQSLSLVQPNTFEDVSSSTSDESSLSDWEADGQVKQEPEPPVKVSWVKSFLFSFQSGPYVILYGMH